MKSRMNQTSTLSVIHVVRGAGDRNVTFEVVAHAGSSYPFVAVNHVGEEVAAYDLTPGVRRHKVEHEGAELHIVTNIGNGYDYVQILDGADEEIAWFEAAKGGWEVERVTV